MGPDEARDLAVLVGAYRARLIEQGMSPPEALPLLLAFQQWQLTGGAETEEEE